MRQHQVIKSLANRQVHDLISGHSVLIWAESFEAFSKRLVYFNPIYSQFNQGVHLIRPEIAF